MDANLIESAGRQVNEQLVRPLYPSKEAFQKRRFYKGVRAIESLSDGSMIAQNFTHRRGPGGHILRRVRTLILGLADYRLDILR
ncbi:hypothetical protein Gmet_0282 [Geobacter metallireducens GS-15]|uniref:Uncharacterized protein n=1 Tax=Geobacter metallireducens (strain ATCC 53774 / DSM 7210 / GS-15) TaxID=269799 RepID=Q39YZ7_GEOMG|nr:hypothetical protein Gmet_0282 [Geobacter metallireducens GS-15]